MTNPANPNGGAASYVLSQPVRRVLPPLVIGDRIWSFPQCSRAGTRIVRTRATDLLVKKSWKSAHPTNLKKPEVFGLTIPPSLLMRAEEVIQ